MIILGIESSCDETAAAVLKMEKTGNCVSTTILSNLISSQHEIHRPYGGVFPELASRRHMEVIRPLVEDALKQAEVKPEDLDGIAVTHTPGLIGALLVGLSFAKAYAYALKKPWIGVSHLEGHLNAPFINQPELKYPQIGLVVSGGHTALYFIPKFGEYQFIGGTLDDAAGEAFDKVAKILNLGYPGGPIVDKLAKSGNSKVVPLPKPKIKELDFSFSGLKTAVRQLDLTKYSTEDITASFQEIVVECLAKKTFEAAQKYKAETIVVTGGVACNSRLRAYFQEVASKEKLTVAVAPPVYCTDNAAMIGYVGGRYLMEGKTSPLSLNAGATVALLP